MAQLNGAFKRALTAVTTNAPGGALSLPNPEAADLIITRLVVDVVTPSGGAATIDAGVAANGSTSADNLIDGLSVAAAGTFDNIEDGGTNGKASRRWNAAQHLTVTASATLAALVANVYIEYIRA
jgi:hypothetical protein